MLDAVLFDNEQGSLKLLQIQLGKIENVHICGSYTKYPALMDGIIKYTPDIAFVDIEVPGKNGLDIALEIKALLPKINIIFVTAYNQYAVKAFEIEAFDYILKPVRTERIQKAIDRISSLMERGDKNAVQVCMMKRFQIRNKNGEAVKWRTKKVEELAAYLIDQKGREISTENAIDVLWPEGAYTNGKKLLYTTKYYLKKDMERHSVDIFENGSNYKVSSEKIKCDSDALSDLLESITVDCTNLNLVEKLFNRYPGAYLDENYYLWAENKRDALEKQFANTIMRIAENLETSGRRADARYVMNRLISTVPCYEPAYKLLMDMYGAENDIANCGKIYQIYSRINNIM